MSAVWLSFIIVVNKYYECEVIMAGVLSIEKKLN